jgi:hypothetical protein
MIQDTIGRIEERIQNAASVPTDTKAELIRLLGTLKTEVEQLSETQSDKAQSIAGFAAVSAHEATRADRNPELLELSLKGLTSTVDEFEKTHPKLAQIVNSISTTLSNLGI